MDSAAKRDNDLLMSSTSRVMFADANDPQLKLNSDQMEWIHTVQGIMKRFGVPLKLFNKHCI
jgi:hypothetical protein